MWKCTEVRNSMLIVDFQSLLHHGCLKTTREIDEFPESKLEHLNRIKLQQLGKQRLAGKSPGHMLCAMLYHVFLAIWQYFWVLMPEQDKHLPKSINYGSKKLTYMPLRNNRQIQMNGPGLPLCRMNY